MVTQRRVENVVPHQHYVACSLVHLCSDQVKETGSDTWVICKIPVGTTCCFPSQLCFEKLNSPSAKLKAVLGSAPTYAGSQ